MVLFISFVLMEDRASTERWQIRRIRLAVIPALVMVVLVWMAFLVDHTRIASFNFSLLGIYPRQLRGVPGIFLSPFVHGSFSHLISNTVPLLVLISLLFYFYSQIAPMTFASLWSLSGLFTWLTGREAFHIGASGLIFALLFFLFFSGLFRKHVPLIAVSMVVTFIYGSSLWSIFPIAEYIDISLSWEAHLSGAAVGLIVAFSLRKRGPQKPPSFSDEEEEEEEEDDSGLP
jgi:membrane associated rhomboid family serine protease